LQVSASCHGETGFFVEPSVLDGTSDKMREDQEEILDQQHEACASHRRSVAAGTVWVNCYYIFAASILFGGYKPSGWGREMGGEVLKNYLETKSSCMSVWR
jgi:acyl-CoA reductase-like NAD-dependent aldehyde dehydrogenase